jgi:hypothetical protein
MFQIVINDGQTPFPNDDIYYIICKEGVYLKKRLGVMESVAPVKNISILKSVNAMAKMHIRKIPATKAQQVINFFKAVYEEYYGEAIVLLFYNQKTKQHKIVCPKQEVSGGGADYNKAIVIDGWDMIGTIHSHASMSAFHSGIDDKDEESFDGLHITFGNMRDDDISVSASIVANGYRVIVDPREYINQMVLTVDVDEEEKIPYAKTWKWDAKQKKMVQVETAGRFYTRRKFDQRYQVQLSKDPKFDPNWMELVEKKVWTSTYKSGRQGKPWYEGWYGHDAGYGVGSYWKNWRGHQNTKGPVQKNLPVVVKPDDTKVVDESAKMWQVLDNLTDSEQKTVLEWAMEQLDGDASDLIKESLGEDNDDLIHYHCVNCEGKFTIDESSSDACCPKCGIDDYLIEISATEMMADNDSQPSDEEIEVNGFGMIECKTCNSSFTKDFLVNGECPTCQTVLVPEEHPSNNQTFDTDYEDDGFIQCPRCMRHFARVSLHFDNHCKFCDYEFDPYEVLSSGITTEEVNEEISKSDSGAYLDPDRDAIEKAAAADEDVERIPVPGQDSVPINKRQRKRGVFASLFKRNKKL